MDDVQHHHGEIAEEGFTLIEVVIALALLMLVAVAALTFFTSGVRTSAELQRRQVAVALANAAVEDARSVPATLLKTSTTPVQTWPQLVTGRSSAKVSAQWAAATGVPLLTTTYPASDPAATATSSPLLDYKADGQVSKQTYTTQVYIGTCYRLRSASAATCGTPVATRTSTPPSGYVEMVRIVAVTTWDPGAGRSCSGSACSYTASVLVDTTGDPAWNTSGSKAVDDTATVQRGTTTSLNVLANDTVLPAASSPVTVTGTTGGITATAASDGSVSVTVPSSTSPGTVTFTYAVRDRFGNTSNTATVKITVTA